MLHLRILSALVGIPIVLALVYLGGPYYAGFIILAVNVGMYEYTAMLKSRGYYLPAFLGYLGVSSLLVMLYLGGLTGLDLVLPAIVLSTAVLAISFLICYEKSNILELALILWGIIYLGGFSSYMILLRQLPKGLTYTFLLLFGVWANDTFAYFAGMKWGKHRLAPNISPKKSVEGSWAGIVGTVLIAFFAASLFPDRIELAPWKAALLGLGISVFAQLGDLLESAIKRQFEIKDAGSIIPGHGGILDRLDSLLFAAPVVYYFFLLMG